MHEFVNNLCLILVVCEIVKMIEREYSFPVNSLPGMTIRSFIVYEVSQKRVGLPSEIRHLHCPRERCQSQYL